MQNLIEEQYSPIVGVWEMLKFDPQREETFTQSRFVNIFLNHFYRHTKNLTEIADRMGLSRRCTVETFRALTGMRFADFIHYFAAYQIHNLMLSYEQQQEEMKARLTEMRSGVGQTMRKNKFADQQLTKTFLGDVQKGISATDSLTYTELAQHVGIFPRSTLAKFVKSKHYEEIVRELKLKKYSTTHKQKVSQQRTRISFEEYSKLHNIKV